MAFQRVVASGWLAADRSDELISGAERHTVDPDVWVAVAKMFAAVGRASTGSRSELAAGDIVSR